MPAVLIATDQVKCLHAPGVAQNVTAPKLTVGGSPPAAVVTNLLAVTGCPQVSPNVPCSTVTITGGRATKLMVGGAPVLLGSLVATAAGTPGGALAVVPSSTKLIAV
jgi:hypothetical protein